MIILLGFERDRVHHYPALCGVCKRLVWLGPRQRAVLLDGDAVVRCTGCALQMVEYEAFLVSHLGNPVLKTTGAWPPGKVRLCP